MFFSTHPLSTGTRLCPYLGCCELGGTGIFLEKDSEEGLLGHKVVLFLSEEPPCCFHGDHTRIPTALTRRRSSRTLRPPCGPKDEAHVATVAPATLAPGRPWLVWPVPPSGLCTEVPPPGMCCLRPDVTSAGRLPALHTAPVPLPVRRLVIPRLHWAWASRGHRWAVVASSLGNTS